MITSAPLGPVANVIVSDTDLVRHAANIAQVQMVQAAPDGVSPETPTGGSNGKRKEWTTEEDEMLQRLVVTHGAKRWSLIASYLNGRVGKQCRERWHNHLRTDISKATWSEAEERTIREAVEKYGKKWATIARMLPGRTENAIKNHWNSAIRKRNRSEARRRREATRVEANGMGGPLVDAQLLAQPHAAAFAPLAGATQTLAGAQMPMVPGIVASAVGRSLPVGEACAPGVRPVHGPLGGAMVASVGAGGEVCSESPACSCPVAAAGTAAPYGAAAGDASGAGSPAQHAWSSGSPAQTASHTPDPLKLELRKRLLNKLRTEVQDPGALQGLAMSSPAQAASPALAAAPAPTAGVVDLGCVAPAIPLIAPESSCGGSGKVQLSSLYLHMLSANTAASSSAPPPVAGDGAFDAPHAMVPSLPDAGPEVPDGDLAPERVVAVSPADFAGALDGDGEGEAGDAGSVAVGEEVEAFTNVANADGDDGVPHVGSDDGIDEKALFR